MANSSFETFKQGGQAIDEAAQKTGRQAEGVHEQAKTAASDAYDSASEYAAMALHATSGVVAASAVAATPFSRSASTTFLKRPARMR